jgi:hypothetical protein
VSGRKVTFYLPRALAGDIDAEAKRTGRAKSSLLQQAWDLAIPEIRKMGTPPKATTGGER